MFLSALTLVEKPMFSNREVVKSIMVILMVEYYAVIKNTVQVLFKNPLLHHLS